MKINVQSTNTKPLAPFFFLCMRWFNTFFQAVKKVLGDMFMLKMFKLTLSKVKHSNSNQEYLE